MLAHALGLHLLGGELGARRDEGDAGGDHVVGGGVEDDPGLAAEGDAARRRGRQKDHQIDVGEVQQGQDLAAASQDLAGLRQPIQDPSVARGAQGAIGDIDGDALAAGLGRGDRRLGGDDLDSRRPQGGLSGPRLGAGLVQLVLGDELARTGQPFQPGQLAAGIVELAGALLPHRQALLPFLLGPALLRLGLATLRL